MSLRTASLPLLFAVTPIACAAGGSAHRGGGALAGPDEAWGKAHSSGKPGGSAKALDPDAKQLAKEARAALKAGDHERCADLAARAAHHLDEGDRTGRASLRLLEARCRRSAGQPGVALRSLSEAWPDLRSPVDKAWANDQARDISLRSLRRSEAAAFSGRVKGDLAEAWLGMRMALLAHERGDTEGALARLASARPALQAIGAGDELARLRRKLGKSGADGVAVGAVLPLSGPLRRVGVRALRGLMLVDGIAVVVKDSAGSADRAAQAVSELASDPAVVAVVGPLDRKAAVAAADRAQEAGLSLISLSVDAQVTAQGDHVFRNFFDPTGEATTIARFATTELGLRRLAVLRPENGYGKRLAEAFEKAAIEAGATVVQVQVYRRRSFDAAIKALVAGPRFEGLFIPDTHSSVSLIAPHLAAAGLSSSYLGEEPKTAGEDRAVQLLGAGAWADRRLLAHGAVRYLTGAVFAAGWWPDSDQPEAIRLNALAAEMGGEGEVFAAYAYDSAMRVARAASGGADRQATHEALLKDRWDGPVATRGFGPARNSDAPPFLVRIRSIGFTALPRNTP
jgi:ABC-type branched-subunit amino acid transport system substrate-binding protein